MASSRRTGTNPSKWTGAAWTSGVNTYGTAGAGREYTALATWEADTDVDIVTAQVSPVLECYADAASYSVTSVVTFTGATSSGTYRRILRAVSTARHGGVPSAGVHFTSPGSGNGAQLFNIDEPFFCLQDLECSITSNNNSNPILVVITTNADSSEVVGMLCHGTNAGGGVINGLSAAFGADNHIVANCILYGLDGYGMSLRPATGRILNNTVVNCTSYGYTYTATEPIYKNNIGYNNTAGDWNSSGGAAGTTHNLSKDATAPATGTYHRSKTLTFANAAGNDYRLAATDTDAIGAGTSLAADTWAFDDDIAFTVRS